VSPRNNPRFTILLSLLWLRIVNVKMNIIKGLITIRDVEKGEPIKLIKPYEIKRTEYLEVKVIPEILKPEVDNSSKSDKESEEDNLLEESLINKESEEELSSNDLLN